MARRRGNSTHEMAKRRGRGIASTAAAGGVALLVAGCGSNGQSTLNPHSKPADQITTLWWAMMVAAWIVLGGTVVLLVISWIRRRREGLPILGQSERGSTGMVIGFGVVVPVACLMVLFGFANFEVGKITGAPARGSTTMRLQVVGHQWFWQFRYGGSHAVIANEVHIPVNTRIDAAVTTDDVIHSFWVPELNRKIDAVPGRVNRILLYADKPGVYRGQCAEFCGLQHANMSLRVYAEPLDRFRSWLAAQEKPAAPPTDPAAVAGERTFLANACASCHTIRGTSAQGRIGPDLTHLASRQTLAGLTIPNDPAHLLAWISDPQHIKPGVKMPGLGLSAKDFRDIAKYLEGLR